LKFSLEVSMNRPASSDLSENAMACTTKSRLPQRSAIWAKPASRLASSVTSISMRKSEPMLAASGSTRFFSVSP